MRYLSTSRCDLNVSSTSLILSLSSFHRLSISSVCLLLKRFLLIKAATCSQESKIRFLAAVSLGTWGPLSSSDSSGGSLSSRISKSGGSSKSPRGASSTTGPCGRGWLARICSNILFVALFRRQAADFSLCHSRLVSFQNFSPQSAHFDISTILVRPLHRPSPPPCKSRLLHCSNEAQSSGARFPILPPVPHLA